MGPGARPVQPGESPDGLLTEITKVRSHYRVHLGTDAVSLSYELKGQQRQFHLPFSKVPLEGLIKSMSWGTPSRAEISGTMVIDLIRGCENVTGRGLRQEEAESITHYGSRRMTTMYVGQIAALGLGGTLAWFGRKNMKFPFRSPKDPARYDVFPMRVLPILKGRYARIMWQVTRVNVYFVAALFLTQPFVRSIADSRMTVGLYQDPRTRDLAMQIKNIDRLRANRAVEGQRAGQSLPQQEPSPEQQQIQDDASPQGFYDNQPRDGQNESSGDSTFTDGNTDTGLLSDSSLQQRQTREASPNAWSKAQSRGSRESFQQNQQQQQSKPSSSDFFFDDASPTAGNDPDMGTSTSYARQQSGGAWSRARRGEGAKPSPTANSTPVDRRGYSNRSQDFETQSDSFSFSKGEEEKRLAKDQAQREFDAMLDRERNDSGSGEYARGMRATEAGEESSSSTGSAWGRRRG